MANKLHDDLMAAVSRDASSQRLDAINGMSWFVRGAQRFNQNHVPLA